MNDEGAWHLLAAGALLGLAFGIAAQQGRLCLLRGLREWRRRDPADPLSEHGRALRAFALAAAVALLGTQALQSLGQIDLSRAQVLRTRFSPWAVLLGGLLFGVGMALARSCGARALVLLGGGNLRAVPVLLCLALAAQATLTGVLAPLRQVLQGIGAVDGVPATFTELLARAGLSATAAQGVATALVAAALLLFALRAPALRRAPREAIAAAVIGALVAAGWWITAHVGVDDFEPAPLTSLSFIGPMAEATLYLQLAVGRDAGIGAAIVAGTVLGAFASALAARSVRIEGFDSPARLAQAMIGGLLMGFGGVLAVGCSIGQGLSGLSTLALASVPACIGIVAGAWLTLAAQERLTSHHTQGALT